MKFSERQKIFSSSKFPKFYKGKSMKIDFEIFCFVLIFIDFPLENFRIFDLEKYFLPRRKLHLLQKLLDGFRWKNFSMKASQARIQRAPRHTNRTIEAKTNRVNVRDPKLHFRTQKRSLGAPGLPRLPIHCIPLAMWHHNRKPLRSLCCHLRMCPHCVLLAILDDSKWIDCSSETL